MKIVLGVILTVIFVSCSEIGEELNESEASTGKHVSNEKELALRNRIIGEWRQINRNCDPHGNNCLPLSNVILWTFEKNDVVWGRYTHPYKISNDTIYIAGIPYSIAQNSGDTLLFHTVNTNDYMKLVKR